MERGLFYVTECMLFCGQLDGALLRIAATGLAWELSGRLVGQKVHKRSQLIFT